MHFALPRRNHPSSPFLASSSRSYLSPSRRRPWVFLLVFVLGIYFLRGLFSGGRRSGQPEAVLVLLLNRTATSTHYLDRVIENRREYAKAHDYGLFIKNVADYPLGNAPSSWARIPVIRHALTEYPDADYFWFLDQDAIIMNPTLSLSEHILSPKRLGSLMRRDIPVVPPDSIIKTYKHVPPERVQLIVSQDHEGIQPTSMIVRNGPWAKYFLDAWYDPIFRFYGFLKAEKHALEHIIQWHPTILTKLAIIPQKIFNSYPRPGLEGAYEEGDFVVHFQGCDLPGRSCEKEFDRFWETRTKT
ncbi:putative alpha-1,6-mannosyltransferase mnn11 [Rhizina undulata]